MILVQRIKSLLRDIKQRRSYTILLNDETQSIKRTTTHKDFIEQLNTGTEEKQIYTDLFIPDLLKKLEKSRQEIVVLQYTMNKRHFGARVEKLSQTLFNLKYRLYDVSSLRSEHNQPSSDYKIRFVFLKEGSKTEINIQHRFFQSKEIK
jgi:sulfur carrier protein ThiS